jgi:hypothetical protein
MSFRLFPAALAAGLAFVMLSSQVSGQEKPGQDTPVARQELPDVPQPQVEVAWSDPDAPQAPSAQTPQQPAVQPPAAGAQGTSSSQATAPQPQDPQKSQHDLAEEQLKQQEKQRVWGVMATFNTTRNPEAVPLSPGQKFKLFFRSAGDPWPFLLNSVVAGIGQAENSEPQWGQGVQGYAKRYGAAYSDYFIGNFFGNAVLPAWWHEDPRYFQKGTGNHFSRALWAAGSTVWAKRDKGTWGPNYANVVGNLIGAAIARAYYPDTGRTVTDTITDGFVVSAEGIVGAEVIEFWPDVVRHHRRKQQEKLARQAAQQKANQ